MRVFFWGLLLLNAGYFSWQYLVSLEHTKSVVESSPASSHSVVLYSEVQARAEQAAIQEQTGKDSKPRSAAGSAGEKQVAKIRAGQSGRTGTPESSGSASNAKRDPAVFEKESRCVSVGMFSNEEALDKAVNLLKLQQVKYGIVTGKKTVERYWVYIPPLSSIDEARKVARRLRSLGIEDYQILATAGKINAISLGIYSNPDIAKNRQSSINQLGFDSMIEVLRRQRSARALRIFPGQNQVVPDSVMGEMLKFEEGLKIEKISCQ